MPTFGLTPTGFVSKQQSNILSDIEGAERTNMSATIDVDPDQPLGQLNGIFSGKLAEIWELLATLYGIIDPDQAEGAAIDNVCALSGTLRDVPTYSTVICNCSLNAATTIPVGATANVLGQPGNTWTAVQNPLLAVGQAAHSTVPGNYVITFQSTTVGPNTAAAGTLTVITAPVTGWNSVSNPVDATPGAFVETDTSLRQKRQQELGSAGGSTVDKLRAVLLETQLPNGTQPVISCTVYENETDFTDVNGLPPHSVECLIFDGVTPALANNVVAQAIWSVKGSGCATYGNASGIAVDSAGGQHTVLFSRPVAVPIYLAYTVTTNSNFPSTGIAGIKALVAAEAPSFLVPGASVIALQLRALPMAPEPGAIAGVVDVPALALGLSASPSATVNLAIGIRQIASVDTSRITVNGL